MSKKYSLKELRNKRNETQEQAAEAIGIARAVFCHYENGLRMPKVDVASKIASHFEVKIEEIIFLYKKDTKSHKSSIGEIISERGA